MIVMSRYLDEVLDLCWYFAHRYACILSPFRFSGCAQAFQRVHVLRSITFLIRMHARLRALGLLLFVQQVYKPFLKMN